MKKIYIYGVRYADIVLYTAKILQNLKHRVLILDKSIDKRMRSFIPVFEEFDLSHGIFDYCGTGYTYGASAGNISAGLTGYAAERYERAADHIAGKKEKLPGRKETEILKSVIDEDIAESAYDVMIVLNDASAMLSPYAADERSGYDIRLFITDEYPENVYELRSALRAIASEDLKDDGTGKRNIFVVRDYTGMARVIINDLQKLAGPSRNFLIPWSKKDRKLEMLAAYNDSFRFVGISEELAGLLEFFCEGIGIDTSGADYKRAFMKAERGKGM